MNILDPDRFAISIIQRPRRLLLYYVLFPSPCLVYPYVADSRRSAECSPPCSLAEPIQWTFFLL